MSQDNHQLLLDGKLQAMQSVGSVRGIRRLGKLVLVLIFLSVPAVLFLPWLQTTSGSGRVIAFSPLERRSEIQAQVSGRVKHLYVVESQEVKKGELIAEIEDNDPDLLRRIDIQLIALETNLQSTKNRQDDLAEKLEQKQGGLEQALEVDGQLINAAEAELEFNEQDFARKETLFEKGIVAQVDLQKAKAELLKAQNKVAEAKAKQRKHQNDINSEIADIRASINKGLAEISKIEKEIADLESKRAKSGRLRVTAPRDGIVTEVATNDGEYLKPGSPICTVIPDTEERFLEIMVDGNYAPLLRSREETSEGETVKGSLVRIQFEGWPAVQFSGWPSVAVGTFGGEVIFIDRQGKNGKFRIIIAPEKNPEDPERKDLTWPDPRWLRLGARAKGWVQIQQVPLWQELWRRFNGFPPALPDDKSPLHTPKKAPKIMVK